MNITIISPKPTFPGLPQFKRIDLSKVSFSMAPPQGVNPADFIFEFMPILGNICGLIYGIEILSGAAEIALQRLVKFSQATGVQSDLCLKDVSESLRSVYTKGFRKEGYKDAAETAMELLLGRQNLFACRKGLPLEWLFSRNTILHAHSLTNPIQCQTLLIFLLYWFYRGAKLGGHGRRLRHVLIVDDASRFISAGSQFDRRGNPSPLGHIMAVLREAGIAVIFVTQLPAQIDPSVLSLVRTVLTVGNVNGEENLRVIKNCMSLTEDQKKAIVGFKPQEMLAFISGHPWSRPIHGWSPYVENLARVEGYDTECIDMIKPWKSLKDIPQAQPTQSSTAQAAPVAQSFDTIWKVLVWDCNSYPFDKVNARIERCRISVRDYEDAKNEALQNGYLIESKAGKAKYLIPTKKAFEEFKQPYPYQRATSVEHAFYVLLMAHILKRRTDIASVKTENPIGTKGATIDIVSTDKSGSMTAYEVTINISNLLSNATKLQDTAYEKIVWLCKDAATAKAVKSYFNKTSLPSELTSKFEYIHLSKFEKSK